MGEQQMAEARFIKIIGAWRSRIPLGFILAALVALSLFPLLGIATVVIWLGVYGFVLAVGWIAFSPARLDRLATTSRGRAVAFCVVAAQAAVYAALGTAAVALGGNTGLLMAVGMMTGWLMSGIVVSRGCGKMFIAATGPVAAGLLVGVPLAVFANNAGPLATMLAAGGGLLLCSAAVLVWREYAALLQSEALARGRAEAATAAKSAFLAAVSHELRTPLSAMQAGALAIERAAVDSTQRNTAALIVESSQMMRTLLDDLLDLAKLQVNRMSVETIAFDLKGAIHNTVLFWRLEARRKGLKLRLTGVRQLPAWVEGDPVRFRQILNNLLSNAMKFTQTGSVTLRIEVASAGSFAFAVEDTGPGMSEAQQAVLFQPFAQADETIARAHGGTGLGLSISRDLSRLMGGDITLASRVGQGSRFMLTVPLPAVPPPAKEASMAPGSAWPGLRVLGVDDHEFNRKALALIMAPLTEDLVLAESGAEALKILSRQSFDVMLLDLHLPGIDGYEIARRLRSTAGLNQRIPIIAVTGAAEDRDRERCLAAGMNAVVAKPIDPSTLFATLAQVLDGGVSASAVA